MSKQLRLRDRLLLGLSLLDQLADTTIGAGNRAYWARKLGPWTPPNYQGSNLTQMIQRMLTAEYLSKEIINGKPVLTITGKGKKQLSRQFSFFKLQQVKWDGHWRLVIFDIPEKDRLLRTKLRQKLVELGFGMWQRSIYISPHQLEEDVAEFLISQELNDMAHVLTAKHRLLGDAKKLANQVWNLDSLNERYQQIGERLAADNITRENNSEEMKKICYDYSVILTDDPCLPFALLPDGWQGLKAQKAIANSII